ncbi:ACDC [Mytilus coruscus]|uniref:ACDC n=1 Tax=Mytilus coruscus TaxID=42192 RepID=A0A6J8DN45_MYTCO|nr:ACDC [Mytilus coruscus]
MARYHISFLVLFCVISLFDQGSTNPVEEPHHDAPIMGHHKALLKARFDLTSLNGQLKKYVHHDVEEEFHEVENHTNHNTHEIEELHHEIKKLHKEVEYLKTHHVAFSAELTNPIENMVADEVVHFDKVRVNSGGSYCADTGKFVAEEEGFFYFSVTICTKKDSIVEMALHVEDHDEMIIHADAEHLELGCASNSEIVHLQKGDHVEVVKHGADGVPPFYVHSMSTFTGFMLH